MACLAVSNLVDDPSQSPVPTFPPPIYFSNKTKHCLLASSPRTTAPLVAPLSVSNATVLLDRRRGVATAAPMSCGVMAKEPACRVGAEASTGRTQKRARDRMDGKTGVREGFVAGEVSTAVPAPGKQRLEERMKAELEAVRDLHRKAVLLCRGAGRSRTAPAAKGNTRVSAAGTRREVPSEEAAKRRKVFPGQLQRAEAPPLPERRTEKTKELQKRRQVEEIARAREECRRQVLEVERTALPDETVYRRDLEELGIAEFEYVVTRTRSQARSQDLGRSSLVGW